MPNLAVSLHATTNATRDRIAPINRKYPLEQLLDACRRFPLNRRRQIMFEYVLLEGVNDTPEDARRLASLLGDIKAKVNLLPLNAAPGIPYERPSDERVSAFGKILADRGIWVSIRKSRGRDIRAACGQLIVEGQKKSAGKKLAALMDGVGSLTLARRPVIAPPSSRYPGGRRAVELDSLDPRIRARDCRLVVRAPSHHRQHASAAGDHPAVIGERRPGVVDLDAVERGGVGKTGDGLARLEVIRISAGGHDDAYARLVAQARGSIRQRAGRRRVEQTAAAARR